MVEKGSGAQGDGSSDERDPQPSGEERPDEGAPPRADRDEAERLGERIRAQASQIAEATCALLVAISEFDERRAVERFVGMKSTAHWLAWSCSMSPGTAREHVRVARALQTMPRTLEEFGAGRLSYSKVREMTRVADQVDEDVLVEMAREMTAAQLARTVSAVRAADGTRLSHDASRRASWSVREDGMIELHALLPAESGAEIVSALELALSRDGSEAPPGSRPTDSTPTEESADARDARITTDPTPEQRRADALADVARGYLQSEPDDRTGEDRHLVLVQVDRAALEGTADVPAGTPPLAGIVGLGPVEPRTAERLACTGRIALVVRSDDGEVLHLGRARRLASRAQRRALRLRDRTCVFPGCPQTRHLDAHHTVPWSEGGPTDIEGLALLCRRHHVIVHEGGLHLCRIDRPEASAGARPHLPRFDVVDENGCSVRVRWPSMLEDPEIRPSDGSAARQRAAHPDPQPSLPLAPPLTPPLTLPLPGPGFRLADCADALLSTLTLADPPGPDSDGGIEESVDVPQAA